MIDLKDALRGFRQAGHEAEFRGAVVIEGVTKRYARTAARDGKWIVQESDHPTGPWIDVVKPIK